MIFLQFLWKWSNKPFLFDTLVFIKCDTCLVVRLVPFFRGYIYFYIKVSKSSFILHFVSFTMSNSADFWYISQVTRGLVIWSPHHLFDNIQLGNSELNMTIYLPQRNIETRHFFLLTLLSFHWPYGIYIDIVSNACY